MILYSRLRSVRVSAPIFRGDNVSTICTPYFSSPLKFINYINTHSNHSAFLQLSLFSIIELINSGHNGSPLRTTERGSRSLPQLSKRNSKETTGMSKCRGYLFIVTDIETSKRLLDHTLRALPGSLLALISQKERPFLICTCLL